MSHPLTFIDGSGRDGSYNRQLLEAFEGALGQTALPFQATYVSASSHRVPNLIPGHDLGADAQATHDTLRAQAMASAGFIIGCPEYNGGLPGGLKNLIDWMAQPNPQHPKGNPFEMKPVVLLSASPGGLGGVKGLQVMRLIMGHLRALILPEQVALPKCHEAFEADGALKAGLAADFLAKSSQQLADFLRT